MKDVIKGTFERGLFMNKGEPILTCPSPIQLHALEGLKHVDYFSPLGSSPECMDGVIGEGRLRSVNQTSGINYYKDLVTDPLTVKLKEEFCDNGSIGIRGTACSLNGPIEARYDVIRDIRQIVREGTDTGRQDTAIMVFDPKGNESISGYPLMYLQYWAKMIQMTQAGGPNIHIFPLLLAYDLSFMKSDGKIYVPIGIDAGPYCIRIAFILDYPNV